MESVRSGHPEDRRGGGLAGWQTRDVVVAAALAVPLGLLWSIVWGQVWLFAQGILPEFGLLVAGFYIAAGVLVGYVIRRPGAALLGEMIAALIEVPLTPFGPVALWLGLLQGLGVEVVFAATRYRNYSLPIMLLAGTAGALFVVVGYEYAVFGYGSLALGVQVLRIAVRLIGGAIFAGLAGKLIGDALARTGVLNNFPIGRARVREI
ncbi:MAG: ECF transporter S component [Chloroflexota bacterium]|nr:ECF transporter S component [Chloroflexota bacterium]